MAKAKRSIEKLDATAREICRLFTEQEFGDVLDMIKRLKKIEVAWVTAFVVDRVAASTRDEFVKFLADNLPVRKSMLGT